MKEKLNYADRARAGEARMLPLGWVLVRSAAESWSSASDTSLQQGSPGL
jgi:hypothetical protein